MFDDYRFRWSVLSGICVAMGGVFLLQSIESVWLNSAFLTGTGALSVSGLQHGEVWRLLSYAFVHGNFWHLFMNVLAILLIGLPLQAQLGNRATGLIVALMTLAGGLFFTLAHPYGGAVLMGGSAIAVGLLTLFCLLYPERPITLLLFFVLPVTIMPKWILYFTAGFNLFGFIFSEVAPGSPTMVAYSAHLGGIVAAWAVSRYLLHPFPAVQRAPKVEKPGWAKKHIFFKGGPNDKLNYKINLSSRTALQQEVDRILDKINTHGFGALTREEKATLDRAKDILGK